MSRRIEAYTRTSQNGFGSVALAQEEIELELVDRVLTRAEVEIEIAIELPLAEVQLEIEVKIELPLAEVQLPLAQKSPQIRLQTAHPLPLRLT